MNIHEYQAKALLAQFGVNVPQGFPALSVEEAKEAANKLPGPVYVVKSQIHAGGRGKGTFKEAPDSGGGVRVVTVKEEVEKEAASMLGNTLETIQTGPEGKVVNRLYIEDGSDIDKEYYLSFVVDRVTSSVTIMASTEGGVEIEEVAHSNPEKILTITVDPAYGIKGFHAREIAFGLGFSGDSFKAAVKLFIQLYNAFVETDASQLEINPLVLTKQGDVIPLDAKFNFDDNALFRHPDIEALRDETEEEPSEREAEKHELSYIKMDGNIGCMVNGAGLAMATMDIIKLHGGEPANFLDVGGGAPKERVVTAFRIILADPNVKGLLVNIFGGIMRCDIIAQGIVEAAKEIGISVPLVVRLEGTNVELGKKILNESGLEITSADDLGDAAEKIVQSVRAEAA